MRNPQEALQEHYNHLKTLYPENRIVGVYHQGSFNYNLQYEGSDFDTKAIVLPSLEEIAENKQPVSTTLVLDNDEHIDVKDIRMMFDNFKKQNINFLEILFTEYSIENPLYILFMEELRENRELITKINPLKRFNSMVGMAKEKYFALEKPYPAQAEVVEKYGYSGKQLHHMVRMVDFITEFLNGESFMSSLSYFDSDREEMVALKRNAISLEGARQIARIALVELDRLSGRKDLLSKEDNLETLELLSKVKVQIIKKSLVLELNNEV